MKKALKIIGILAAILAGLLLIFVLVCSISQAQGRKKDLALLESHGLCRMVEAGDVSLNMPVFGAENPRHTIVALPGSGDSSFAAAMKAFSGYLSGEDRLVVAERPGYGISDVTKSDMTVEYVVETTRTALKNAGIEAPYVLMPHSLGGIYAVYWENTYPEEIEGVFLLDTSYAADMSTGYQEPEGALSYLPADLGILRMLWSNMNLGMTGMMPEDCQEDTAALERYRSWGSNRSQASEYNRVGENATISRASIQANSIPKCYVYTDPVSEDDARAALEFLYTGSGLQVTDEMVQEAMGLPTAAEREERAAYVESLGNCEMVNIPASHFLYLHKPQEVADELERFLGQLN